MHFISKYHQTAKILPLIVMILSVTSHIDCIAGRCLIDKHGLSHGMCLKLSGHDDVALFE